MKREHQKLQAFLALTLLELLCALAVAGVLIATLFGTLAGTIQSIHRTRHAMRDERVLSGLARIMRSDLLGVLACQPGFIGRQPSGGEESIFLAFSTTHSLAPSKRGLSRVEYLLRPSRRRTNRFELMRRERPFRFGESSRHALEESMADGIVSLHLAFYHMERWRNEWSGIVLPSVVRVNLVSEGERGEEAHELCFAPAVHREEALLP